jgi:hypothetical protein
MTPTRTEQEKPLEKSAARSTAIFPAVQRRGAVAWWSHSRLRNLGRLAIPDAEFSTAPFRNVPMMKSAAVRKGMCALRFTQDLLQTPSLLRRAFSRRKFEVASMHRSELRFVLAIVLAAPVGCSAERDAPPRSRNSGVSAGGAGGAEITSSDYCEDHADRATCCADFSCGWHHQIGHSLWYDVAPCIARERVCEVAGEKIRDCPEGMICHVDGGWSTADDCTTLPPEDEINVFGRGICVFPDVNDAD